MGTQRFRALVAAGPRGRAVIAVPLAIVELAPEGPQRGDLADDIASALAANPAAAAFFDTLAQFYRKAYLRWIDATTRRRSCVRLALPKW